MEQLVGTIDDFGSTDLRSVQVAGTAIVLCRLPDGTVTALLDRCSHANVRLSAGRIVDNEVECPAHLARFDCRTGDARCVPAVVGVKCFPVSIDEGKIFVTVA